ncbi:MAG: DUF1674 domain-containing protein [Candidimonas sp.]|nr:MAG: DUF1674 domain-containing protein [Candidimonas sp.]
MSVSAATSATSPQPVPARRPRVRQRGAAGQPAAADDLPGTDPRDRATRQGDGLDPTRYGDWEKNGRCIDF